MSLNNIDKVIVARMRRNFDLALKNTRRKLNKFPTAIEFSPEVLKRNLPKLKDDPKQFINKIYLIFKDLYPSAQPVERAKILEGKFITRKTYYKRTPTHFIIIAPSYKRLSTILKNISRAMESHPAFGSKRRGNTLYRRFGLGNEKQIAIESTLAYSSLAKLSSLGQAYLKDLRTIHSKYRVRYSRKVWKDVKGRLAFIYVVPQDKDLNNSLAYYEKKLVQELKASLVDLEGSPSFINLLLQLFDNVFFGKKLKKQSYVTKKDGSFSAKQELYSTSAKLSTGKTISSSLGLLSYINLYLHDQIKRNMGSGQNSDVLNYRTGRFAHSARVLSFSRTRDSAINITYTYMRYPYDVFLPGGKLYKPGRDPRKIIGKSIRELVQRKVLEDVKVRTRLQ